MNASVDRLGPRTSTAELGMWVFLASEVLFFSVLLFAYCITRLHHPLDFAAASRHTDLTLGTANTGILLTSSLTMALAVRSFRLGEVRATRCLLGVTLILGAGFLGLKLVEYLQDYHEHLVPWLDFAFPSAHYAGARLFFLLYFATTGTHAIHLIIGLALVSAMLVAVARGRLTADRADTLEVAALYWHLIDIVWIFLYPLLYLVSRS